MARVLAKLSLSIVYLPGLSRRAQVVAKRLPGQAPQGISRTHGPCGASSALSNGEREARAFSGARELNDAWPSLPGPQSSCVRTIYAHDSASMASSATGHRTRPPHNPLRRSRQKDCVGVAFLVHHKNRCWHGHPALRLRPDGLTEFRSSVPLDQVTQGRLLHRLAEAVHPQTSVKWNGSAELDCLTKQYRPAVFEKFLEKWSQIVRAWLID